MPSDLEIEFQKHVLRYCDECKKIGQNPKLLLKMIEEKGARGAVHTLFNARNHSRGFAMLKDKDRLDLAMEAAVLEYPRYHELFTPFQLEKARGWLDKAGYILKVKN